MSNTKDKKNELPGPNEGFSLIDNETVTLEQVNDEFWKMYFGSEDEEPMENSKDKKNELTPKEPEPEEQAMEKLKLVIPTNKRKALKSFGTFELSDALIFGHTPIDSSIEEHISPRKGKAENLPKQKEQLPSDHNSKKKKLMLKGSEKSQASKARRSKNTRLRGDEVDRGVEKNSSQAEGANELSELGDWSCLEEFLWPSENADINSTMNGKVLPIFFEPVSIPLDITWPSECADILRQIDGYDLSEFDSEADVRKRRSESHKFFGNGQQQFDACGSSRVGTAPIYPTARATTSFLSSREENLPSGSAGSHAQNANSIKGSTISISKSPLSYDRY